MTQGSNNYQAQIQFEALAGGTVTLPARQDDQHGHGGAGERRQQQRVERGALTGFTEANGWTYSTLQASNGGTVNDGRLASLSNVTLTIAGAGENRTPAA